MGLPLPLPCPEYERGDAGDRRNEREVGPVLVAPNILLIMSDQHRFDCLGCNGHPFVRTPHLDALAAAGVNFTRAFCPAPICTPARVSLLTGLWPAQHGVITNWDSEAVRGIPEGLSTFSSLLHRGGYRMGYVGKWHADPRRGPLEFGFDTYDSGGGYGAWRRARGLPARPHSHGWFGETDPFIRPEESPLAWEADLVIAQLRAQAEKGKRFFLRWDPVPPHLPNVVPEPYASMYPPADIPPWPSFPDPLIGKPYIQAQQRRTWKVDGFHWRDWAPIVGRYLGEISLLDAQIGRILAALRSLGLDENTVVVYTSDHGDMCGGHGMMDKMYVMYEDVVHVPLIVAGLGPKHAARTCTAFVCNALDLAATFCDLAGIQPAVSFQGESLRAVLDGDAPERAAMFSSFHGNQFGLYSQRMVREAEWKYVWNPTAEDELYHLREDPGELCNCAADPAHQQDLARLRVRLVQWMEACHDVLLNSWTKPQLLQGLKV